MGSSVTLNTQYSTTRLTSKDEPVIVNRSDDQFDTILFLPKSNERKGEGGLRTKGYFKSSFEDKPLISIVTVVFNGEKHLEETIQSVITQNYDNVEYIIIDGGSTDSTLEIIKKYEDFLDYWISEKDKGIYDAMNKGLRLVSGDLVGVINADDYYLSNVLTSIAEVYKREKAEVIYGDNYYIYEEKKKNIPAHSLGIKYKLCSYSFKWIWVKMLFAHPASFIALKTYKKFGGYDENFQISADYDLFIRLVKQEVNFYYYKKIIAGFREGGVSTLDIKLLQKENFKVRKKNSIVIAYSIEFILRVLSFLRKLRKRMKS